MKPITAHDCDILARTVYGEARGGILAEQIAVASVILNRAKQAAAGFRQHQFGDGSIAGACLAPAQFSCWLAADPNRAKLLAATLDDPAYRMAMLAACGTADMRLGFLDPTQGCLFYYAPASMRPPGARPPWEKPEHFFGMIGRQKFYRSD